VGNARASARGGRDTTIAVMLPVVWLRVFTVSGTVFVILFLFVFQFFSAAILLHFASKDRLEPESCFIAGSQSLRRLQFLREHSFVVVAAGTSI
jgi:hypothetical protein